MTDSRDKIREALRAQGVREDALDTAEAEFAPTQAGNAMNAEGDWTFKGSTTTLRKHAQRYAETHRFMLTSEERQVPNPADKHAPRYPDGTLVPHESLSAEECFDIQAKIDADKAAEERGEQPEYAPAKSGAQARKELHAEAIAANKAAIAEKARIQPQQHVAPEFAPSHDGMTADECFDAAGEVK